jgi:hypothetical protein
VDHASSASAHGCGMVDRRGPRRAFFAISQRCLSTARAGRRKGEEQEFRKQRPSYRRASETVMSSPLPFLAFNPPLS